MRNPSALQGLTRQIAERAHLAILAVGAAWILVYAWPGLMTMDGTDQLTEARAGFFTDSHPPLMALIWRAIDAVYPGPAGMLLLQTLVVISGLYLVLRRVFRPRPAAIATVVLLWFPPIFTPLAAIWKDIVMAGFLLLGIAALAADDRRLKLLGLAAFVVATGVRYNAPAATFAPIVLLFVWRPTQHVVARYAIAAGVWIAVTLAALGIGSALTDRKMHIWQSSLALMDIAGTLSNVDGTLPDSELRELLAGTELLVDRDIHAALRRRYNARDYSPLIQGDGRLWNVPIAGTTPAPASQRDAISRAFWETVTSHPAAYVKQRSVTMGHVLALTLMPESTVMHHRLQYKPLLAELGLPSDPSIFQWRWQRRLSHLAARHWPSLYRAWIYLVISIALLAFCRRQRDIAAILLSGIGLESSLFVLAPTPDYRYSHWMVICACVATVMLVARRMKSVHNTGRDES